LFSKQRCIRSQGLRRGVSVQAGGMVS
jgi:hypothetical protein